MARGLRPGVTPPEEFKWYGYADLGKLPRNRIILSYGYVPGRLMEVSGQVLYRWYVDNERMRPFTYWIILPAPDGSKSLEGFKRAFPSPIKYEEEY